MNNRIEPRNKMIVGTSEESYLYYDSWFVCEMFDAWKTRAKKIFTSAKQKDGLQPLGNSLFDYYLLITNLTQVRFASF